jgi:hypothetical protein
MKCTIIIALIFKIQHITNLAMPNSTYGKTIYANTNFIQFYPSPPLQTPSAL